MSLVEFAIEGEIAIVTINRPEARNAVDQPTAAALADAFRRFDADGALSVAILTGAGPTFCAGADLKAVATDRGNRVTENGDGPLGCTRMLLGKPVIAAVEGFAVAGGIELALWCLRRRGVRDGPGQSRRQAGNCPGAGARTRQTDRGLSAAMHALGPDVCVPRLDAGARRCAQERVPLRDRNGPFRRDARRRRALRVGSGQAR